MKRFFLTTFVTIVFLLPVATFFQETGSLLQYFNGQSPPGQGAFIVMKFIGIYGLILLWLQVMSGSFPELIKEYTNQQSLNLWHMNLGLYSFLFILLHPLLFSISIYLRERTWNLPNLFFPSFSGTYYKFMVSLGVIAFYCLFVGVFAAFLRKKMSMKAFRIIHGINYIVFILGCIHAIKIGSTAQKFPLKILIQILLFTGITAFISKILKFFKNLSGSTDQ